MNHLPIFFNEEVPALDGPLQNMPGEKWAPQGWGGPKDSLA